MAESFILTFFRNTYDTCSIYRRGICPGGKTTGGDMSGVEKLLNGDMSGEKKRREGICPGRKKTGGDMSGVAQ